MLICHFAHYYVNIVMQISCKLLVNQWLLGNYWKYPHKAWVNLSIKLITQWLKEESTWDKNYRNQYKIDYVAQCSQKQWQRLLKLNYYIAQLENAVS